MTTFSKPLGIGDAVETFYYSIDLSPLTVPRDPDKPVKLAERWMPATVVGVRPGAVSVAFANGTRKTFEPHHVRRPAHKERDAP